MSRSIPDERIPNPATRFFEWSGSKGNLKYFDKGAKQNIEVPIPFEFMLLDQLSTVKGWSDDSESGIYANEVKDTRSEVMIVKAFKQKEPLAEGFYGQIKDTVKARGGHFVSNCYIAYQDDSDDYVLASLQFHGAALRSWMEFSNDKANRNAIYKQGISLVKAETGKKGAITFKTPVFELVDLPREANDRATEIDRDVLQPYLRNYFKRTRIDQTEPLSNEDEPRFLNEHEGRENPNNQPFEEEIPF